MLAAFATVFVAVSNPACYNSAFIALMVLQIWDKNTLECVKVLTGHTGSVLCLQYDENVIVTGSSDSTVRYSDLSFLSLSTTEDIVCNLIFSSLWDLLPWPTCPHIQTYQGMTKPLSTCLGKVNTCAGQAHLPGNLPTGQVKLSPKFLKPTHLVASHYDNYFEIWASKNKLWASGT